MSFGDIVRRLVGAERPATPDTDSRTAKLLTRYLLEAKRGSNYRYNPRETNAFSEMLEAGEALQDYWATAWEMAGERVKRLAGKSMLSDSDRSCRDLEALNALIGEFHRRKIVVSEANLIRMLVVLAQDIYVDKASSFSHWLPISGAMRMVERLVETTAPSPKLRAALQSIQIPQRIGQFEGQSYDATPIGDYRICERIYFLLDPSEKVFLDYSETWASQLEGWVERLEPDAAPARRKLAKHAFSAGGTRPTGPWLKKAKEAVEGVGTAEFTRLVAELFPVAQAKPGFSLCERNATALQGLVWCCGHLEDPEVARAVGALAERMYRKVPGVGAMSPRVANACVRTLERMTGQEPVAQLARLSLRVKDRTGLRLIQEALESAAERMGMTVEELAEITVPTYGLETPGVLRVELGRFRAEAWIEGAKLGDWLWKDDKGKTQKAVPAEVKSEHGTEWKEFQAAAKEIDKMLPAQRDRIERLMSCERSLALRDWRARYLDHPLLAGFARRLVWHFETGERSALGIWQAGGLVGVQDESLDWLSEETRVRLWHPAGAEPLVVLAWREWLDSHQVTQPFKQAHREVYLLTEAELNTETYSNRFAAHVLKQHQFSALCRQRGWSYQLQGWFDSGGSVPTLVLPGWGLRAEFWVEPVTDEGSVADSGVSLYVTTDQVRFYDRHNAQMPLSEVPALAFTEVMRDVDLFVGVCSVGNDPQWQDGGPDGRYREYWESYSFGDLSASAETRRSVLEKLLPRLKISSRCAITGKFLVVRGDLKTYKIHLGSGNILMEPNDQYLCIVSDRSSVKSGDGKLFLPFEGDSVLSLILSKALLLADDTKITDKIILSQLKR